jgi:3-hydroxyisobutyrate dehydrogenase
MDIGFIGLGTMGQPMCRNIMTKRPETVWVYDVAPAQIEALVAEGAKAASSIADIGQRCDVVITMVPRSEHVQAVHEELKASFRPGQVIIDMSTIAPAVSVALAQQVAAAGATMLDAPVVKSQPAAVAGTLGIYVGGDEAVFAQFKELLLTMGNSIIYLGANGAGLTMKLCHNMLVAQIQNGVNEMMTLAQRSGIDIDDFVTAISYGGGQNFYLDVKNESIKKGDFAPAFSVQNMHKDVNLASQLVEEQELNLPGVELVKEVYERAMKSELGGEDFSATIKVVRGK